MSIPFHVTELCILLSDMIMYVLHIHLDVETIYIAFVTLSRLFRFTFSLQIRTEVWLAIRILSDSKDWSQTIHIVGVLHSKVKKEINFLTACAWERFFFFCLHQPF